MNFDQLCTPLTAAPITPEKKLIVNGELVVDSQHQSFTSSNLTILDTFNLTTFAVPVGSYQLNGSRLSKLYFCSAGVCKVDDAGFTGSISSGYTSAGAAATTIYDPVLGKVDVAANQLLLCSPNLGAGLDSPFQSGSLVLTGSAGSLTITYSGCGQTYHAGSW